ncbi:type II toxin-antitoxin system Phd/YefM family antitoxin [Bryobacter aggregatus]|uniref:type II toxin-antitoxin system Phd/YefM family antitoxin n=1 Tax=Bryobacter aggregatus TaxID=360054 RepID=UPI00068C7D76|nr:type II toxin-antitoxin system prevent-host-death family antitoxin [Bryobacter aggregatus]
MDQFSIQDAKTHLSKILDQVVAGVTVVINRHNKPIAEIRPIAPKPAAARKRVPGLLKGRMSWTEDCFAPMSEQELSDFEGAPVFPLQAKAAGQ